MITIFIKATHPNNLRDLIRSLINNAESKDSFQIFVGGDPDRDDEWRATIAEYAEQANIFLMKNGEPPKEINTELVWMLADDVFILGYQWDKRINFYKDNFSDEIVVMFPSGYKPYGTKSEAEIAGIAERHPVLSAKWVELAGLYDAEMICRVLFLKHAIDRRIDIRLIDVQERGAPLPLPDYDEASVTSRADAVAAYIKHFTPSRT